MKTDAQLAKEGNEKIKDKDVKVVEGTAKTVKKQKKSVSYALKAIRSHIGTLQEDGLWNDEEAGTVIIAQIC